MEVRQILLRALHAALGVTTQKVENYRLLIACCVLLDIMERSREESQKKLHAVFVHQESGVAKGALLFSFFFFLLPFFLFSPAPGSLVPPPTIPPL